MAMSHIDLPVHKAKLQTKKRYKTSYCNEGDVPSFFDVYVTVLHLVTLTASSIARCRDAEARAILIVVFGLS